VYQGDSGGTTKSVVDTEYDSCACSPLGKIKRVSQPYAPGGTVYWTTHTYDGLGRTTSVSLPGGTGTTTYVYQGNTVKVTDPAGKWKKFTTDAMGNLTKVTEPDPAGGADLDSNYTYDMFSHLTQVSMIRGASTQTRSFAYNANQML
jgi:YD repeat-containing protein